MVRPVNPLEEIIGKQRKAFIQVINGLNVLAALAIHEGSHPTLEIVIKTIHEQSDDTVEGLQDAVTQTINFIGSLNADLLNEAEKDGFGCKEIDFKYKDEDNAE